MERIVEPIQVDGVTYEIDWDAVKVGDSFFVPCVNTTSLNMQMSNRAKKLRWEITFDIRPEGGKWGVRYWRTL